MTLAYHYYTEGQYLQRFYLNCCVKTKTHEPDLSKFSNPYLGINTSIARVLYHWNSATIIFKNFSDVESGRISSAPIKICGRYWYVSLTFARLDKHSMNHIRQLILESGPGMPIVFVHLKLLPDNETHDAFSSLDQAPILAANFIIRFRSPYVQPTVMGEKPRDLTLGTLSDYKAL